MQIKRYILPNAGRFVLPIPKGGHIRHFEALNAQPYIWVEAEPNAQSEIRSFVTVTDDSDVPNAHYVASCRVAFDTMMHLFEVHPTQQQRG